MFYNKILQFLRWSKAGRIGSSGRQGRSYNSCIIHARLIHSQGVVALKGLLQQRTSFLHNFKEGIEDLTCNDRHVRSLSLKNMHFFFSSRDDLLSLLPLLSAELICSLACKKRKFNKKSLCVSAQPWKKKSCRPWIKCMDRPGSQMGLLLLFFGSQIQEFKESFRKRRRRIFTQFTFCFQLQIMATLTQSRGAGPKEGLFSRERLNYTLK